MSVVWSGRALRDRLEIGEFISNKSGRAAAALDLEFLEASRILAAFPKAGRAGRMDGTRELSVSGTQYLLIYAVREETVEILRVLHGAQQWP
jgi:toxin ParE1/3/4